MWAFYWNFFYIDILFYFKTLDGTVFFRLNYKCTISCEWGKMMEIREKLPLKNIY